MVGAYLAQNTAWTNVERALDNLRSDKRLTIEGIRNVRAACLEAGFRGAAHPPSAVSTAHRTLVQIYNQMHGLIVGSGKQHRKKKTASSEACPLRPFLPISQAARVHSTQK